MIRPNILSALVFVLVAACGESSAIPASATTQSRADSAIYAILVDSLRGKGDSVDLESEFAAFPDSAAAVPTLSGWVHKQLPALDSALVVALASERYGGSVRATLHNERGVRWSADRSKIASPKFSRKYRQLSFTRVAYDSNWTHAVVYASMWCGALCGDESFYAFELRNGVWRKVGQVVRISS